MSPEGFGLVIGGKKAKRGELPWHAGIFRKTSNPYTQICGGSVVSKNAVISGNFGFNVVFYNYKIVKTR